MCRHHRYTSKICSIWIFIIIPKNTLFHQPTHQYGDAQPTHQLSEKNISKDTDWLISDLIPKKSEKFEFPKNFAIMFLSIKN